MECYCIWQGGRNEGPRALLLFSLFFSPLSLAALAPEPLSAAGAASLLPLLKASPSRDFLEISPLRCR